MQIMAALFYEFHSERIISRAGQPIETRSNIEIGPPIEREEAVRVVSNGGDVYTARKADAKQLAAQLYAEKPGLHEPHQGSYFQHFHPGQEAHEYDSERKGPRKAIAGPGHVYFGARGESFDAKKAKMRELERVRREEAKLLAQKVVYSATIRPSARFRAPVCSSL